MGGATANLVMRVLTVVAAKQDTKRQQMALVKVYYDNVLHDFMSHRYH